MSKKMFLLALLLAILALVTAQATPEEKAKDCEVCIGVLSKLEASVKEAKETNLDKIEAMLKKQCAESTHPKEKRFCWYVGAAKDSATNIVWEAAKPLAMGVPAEKVCQMRLKKKDSAICALRYEGSSVFVEDESSITKPKPKPKPKPKKPLIDFAGLPKMKIKDLKALLTKHHLSCDGCVEKFDFIKRLRSLDTSTDTTKDEL